MSYKDKDFVTGQEFCKILNISNSTLYRWIKSGKIKAIRISDRVNSPVRIPTAEIDRLLIEDSTATNEDL